MYLKASATHKKNLLTQENQRNQTLLIKQYSGEQQGSPHRWLCLLYTSDAADE